MDELWVDINILGYQISNLGNVRNYRGQYLKIYPERVIRNPDFYTQRLYRGKYVKINKRIHYIPELMETYAPDTRYTNGLIWASDYRRHRYGI